MKKSSADIMRRGQRVIRALNDPCDASCATWFACANSKSNGVCIGFVLMNGQTRKHLDKILNEDDAIYIQNCVRMIQNGDMSEDKESLIGEVLRFIPPPTPREMGFSYMAKCALGVSAVPTLKHTEPEREEHASSGFSAMLSASSKGKKTDEDVIQKALDEMEQDEAKHRQQSSEPTRRGMGFANMLAASQTGTFEGDEEPQSETRDRASVGFQRRGAGFGAMLEAARPSRAIEKPEPEIRGFSSGNATTQSVETEYDVKPIPYGLAAHLEAMSPNKTHETLDEKPHVRRGMGFSAMLEGARSGTE